MCTTHHDDAYGEIEINLIKTDAANEELDRASMNPSTLHARYDVWGEKMWKYFCVYLNIKRTEKLMQLFHLRSFSWHFITLRHMMMGSICCLKKGESENFCSCQHHRRRHSRWLSNLWFWWWFHRAHHHIYQMWYSQLNFIWFQLSLIDFNWMHNSP